MHDCSLAAAKGYHYGSCNLCIFRMISLCPTIHFVKKQGDNYLFQEYTNIHCNTGICIFDQCLAMANTTENSTFNVQKRKRDLIDHFSTRFIQKH